MNTTLVVQLPTRREKPMGLEPQTPTVSAAARWTGRILGGLAAAFLLFDGAMKLAKPDFVVEGTTKYGYAEAVLVPLGIVLIASTLLYLIPRTAVLGAILLTGYLGGAVDCHVRAGEGAFNVLFPVVFGAILWGGLYLRDVRVRALVPVRRS
jgi:hypothetical protein